MTEAVGHNPTTPSGAPSAYQPTSDDLSLEAGIRVARDCARHCTTRESKAMALRLAADLAARCSPELWARIEGEPGLGALSGPASAGASDVNGVAPEATCYDIPGSQNK